MHATSIPHRNPLPWLVLTTFLWGGSFVFNKIAFREMHPVLFLFLRFSLATAVMGLVCLPRLRRLDLRTLRKGVTVGLALAAANFTFVLGVSGTSISRAGFLNNLFVLIVPLFSLLFWREKAGAPLWFGVALAAAGIFEMAAGGTGFSLGDLLSVVCSFFIAAHIILVSRVLSDEDVYLVTLVQFATVAAAGGAAVAAVAPAAAEYGPASIGALLYCAVFPTVVCFTIQNVFQRYVSATRAGLIYTLDPVWSLIGGMAILGERLSAREWWGCVLILAGVLAPLVAAYMGERREPVPAEPASGN